jgi:hypothetical protein
MLASSRTAAVAVSCLTLALVAGASGAYGAPPATVTVRVEGATETKLAQTQVTTTTQPVEKDGKPEDSCPGTNAAGALQLATGGNWNGKWFGGGLNSEGKFKGLGYALETVLGENHAFGSGAFWDVWFNNREAQEGVCEHELQAGEQMLVFPCPEAAKECPAPLGVEAPSSAGVGEAIQVTVNKYSPAGQGSPVAGASIAGAAATVSSDASGHATLSFASAGLATLRVSASGSVRTEAAICVHNPNESGCGTSSPSALSVGSSSSAGMSSGHPASASAPYRGPYAVVAQIGGIAEHHVYRRGHAPRLLAGTVSAHTAVTSVSIALRRTYRNRCLAYSSVRELFVRARCGTAPFFQVSSTSSFSYLLPTPLLPGRYVLDVEATDAAGNRTTLARGTSRIVFFVR